MITGQVENRECGDSSVQKAVSKFFIIVKLLIEIQNEEVPVGQK